MTPRVLQLQWEQHPNFFALWRARRAATQLLYVIGVDHHCYVGSIGAREGRQGLAMRYQWQYLQRAKAIFGLDEEAGQPAYSAVLVGGSSSARDILAAEAFVQHSLIQARGADSILCGAEDLIDDVTFTHAGDVPPFLAKA